MNALSLAATEVHYVLVAAGRFAAAKVRSWPGAAVAWIDPRVGSPLQPSNLKADARLCGATDRSRPSLCENQNLGR